MGGGSGGVASRRGWQPAGMDGGHQHHGRHRAGLHHHVRHPHLCPHPRQQPRHGAVPRCVWPKWNRLSCSCLCMFGAAYRHRFFCDWNSVALTMPLQFLDALIHFRSCLKHTNRGNGNGGRGGGYKGTCPSHPRIIIVVVLYSEFWDGLFCLFFLIFTAAFTTACE